MLDEEQGGRDGLRGLLRHDVTVEEGLEVVVAVLLNVGRVEDGVDIGQRFQAAGARLVVDHADALFASDGVIDHVETVDKSTYLHVAQHHADRMFEAEDGERRQTTVEFQKLMDVMDDDLTVDDMQAVEQGQVEFFVDGGIDSPFYLDTAFQKVVEGHSGDGRLAEGLVERLAGFVEDVAEDAVVDEFFFVVVGLFEVADISVEEAQLTAQVGADGCGTDAAPLFGEAALEGEHHVGGLGDGLWRAELGRLTSTQCELLNGSVEHELEHEARHLAFLCIDCGVVVDDGDILGALQQTVEVVLVDGHLMVDGGEAVGFADGVGDERGVVDALGHVAFIAGEQQHVVEVEVAGFEHTHHLQAFGRFSVEGDGGLLDELLDESLQGADVEDEGAVVDEVAHTVQQCVDTVEGFRIERRFLDYARNDRRGARNDRKGS